MEEPRDIAGYKIKQSFSIGGKDIVFCVKDEAEIPYMVCTITYNNPLGAAWPLRGCAGDDYLEMVNEYIGRIGQETERLYNIRTMREERGVTGKLLTVDDCIPQSGSGDYTGQVLVIDKGRLSPEYHSISNQLVYATHGNGCRPEARGVSVFATNIYTGEHERWSRAAILGVIKPERMPDWAKERLAEIVRTPAAPAKRRYEPER